MLKNEVNERDKFILEKAKDFTPIEIEVLLKREGFAPISHTRIYQILADNGVQPVGMKQRRIRRK